MPPLPSRDQPQRPTPPAIELSSPVMVGDRPKHGGSGRSPKRATRPTLGDRIIPVKRAVHDGGPDFQHQMSAPRRPSHLLLGIHSPMQQPLHSALGDRRRNWFLASAGCRVVDDDVGLSGHISLEIAQKPRHLACGGGNRRPTVDCYVYCAGGLGNEIQSPFDLTMPETPSNPLDRPGEASTSLAISFRGVGPARGWATASGWHAGWPGRVSRSTSSIRVASRSHGNISEQRRIVWTRPC